LRAIAYNIALAHRFVAGMKFEEFVEDERTVYAIVRCLEIISEASRRLPNDLKARHPQVRWPQIAAAGNVYRHEYEDIVAEQLWTTVHEQLDDLEQAVTREQQ
jgi:uncharacterized protein with HEPN domain